jgi:hypothetical protein
MQIADLLIEPGFFQAALSKYHLPVWGGGFGLDGLVEDAVEALDEGGWVFEWDAFEEEGLVEE